MFKVKQHVYCSAWDLSLQFHAVRLGVADDAVSVLISFVARDEKHVVCGYSYHTQQQMVGSLHSLKQK